MCFFPLNDLELPRICKLSGSESSERKWEGLWWRWASATIAEELALARPVPRCRPSRPPWSLHQCDFAGQHLCTESYKTEYIYLYIYIYLAHIYICIYIYIYCTWFLAALLITVSESFESAFVETSAVLKRLTFRVLRIAIVKFAGFPVGSSLAPPG